MPDGEGNAMIWDRINQSLRSHKKGHARLTTSAQELYHDILGSILDREEMTPYLLQRVKNYEAALKQATKMMGNRGFDTVRNDELQDSERRRALNYIERVYGYFFEWMFPFVKNQLEALIALNSSNAGLYSRCRRAIEDIEVVLKAKRFRAIVREDPRHLFLLASSRKYPRVMHGYRGRNMVVPARWQQAACSILKMGNLIRSVEEDSQDIHDYAQLGIFLEAQGLRLEDLYKCNWEDPTVLPESESAQRAFVCVSAFFRKLNESVSFDAERELLRFDSGDGVEVDIAEIKARLKSPESMFTKLGKNLEGEAYDIRDILAITFVLKNRDDTLKLFHALQKRGVILQENTASHSITQTLFDDPASMREATRRLMISIARNEGTHEIPDERDVLTNATRFYEALSANAAQNVHSSVGHRKFQCKIGFSVPIHRAAGTSEIILPGTSLYPNRDQIEKKTQQHTLGVELRISDEQSWNMSEQKGDSHHDAYKLRQLIAVMNRIFKNHFCFPEENLPQLRKDQLSLFA